MAFYRFKDPTYNEADGWTSGGNIDGIPYSYINVKSEGVGLEGSAFVDGPLQGGVNPGTLLVGFTEDGKSGSVNRGLKALAEGADHLDDLLHRDLGEPTATPPAVGTDNTTFTINGEVWVGTNGSPTAVEFESLIQIWDVTRAPFLKDTGAVYQSISVTGIAGVGGGWVTNPLVTVNTSIPNGLSYTATYLARKSPASQDAAMLAAYHGQWRSRDWLTTLNVALKDWTFFGDKTFGDLVTFSSLTQFNASITVGAGGITLDSGDMNVIAGDMNVIAGDMNVIAGDVSINVGEVLYPTPRARVTTINLANAVARRDADMPRFEGVSGAWEAAPGSSELNVPIDLPDGAVITQIDVQHTEAGGETNTCQFVTVEYQSDGAGGSVVTLLPTFTGDGDNDTDTQSLGPASGELPFTVDNNLKFAYVRLLFGADGNCLLWMVRVFWTDPGPRNY